ncbi:hypothetical protein BC629DRAFT_1553832 [Irpex lacteus]|nr:hypothetical protein BC629DRAFT_1553832 [Irpex lacteus]
MTAATDLPPELFEGILFYVCEDADGLLSLPDEDVPKRKGDIKNITACSLVCVYWARTCRQQLFQDVTFKKYQDLPAFLSLVSGTTKRFTPVSEHVRSLTLMQRVGDRPWIHLCWMQPSLFPFKRNVEVCIFLEDSEPTINAVTPRHSTYRRLFAGLPRTLPSFCLQTNGLVVINVHFVTPYDVISLLDKFGPNRSASLLGLLNVTWDTQARFEGNLLINETQGGMPLDVGDFAVAVRGGSPYTAETAWLSSVTRLRHFKPLPLLPMVWHSSWPVGRIGIHPLVQRALLDICKLLCQAHKVPDLYLEYGRPQYVFRDIPTTLGLSPSQILSRLLELQEARACRSVPLRDLLICSMRIGEHANARRPLAWYDRSLSLSFFSLDPWARVREGSSATSLADHISILCVSVSSSVSTEEHSTSRSSSAGTQNGIAYPWEKIVGICAEQEDFRRLQMVFDSHDYLVHFMKVRRRGAVLGKLDGRVHLFYMEEDRKIYAADFETLEQLPGGAHQHGYIDVDRY